MDPVICLFAGLIAGMFFGGFAQHLDEKARQRRQLPAPVEELEPWLVKVVESQLQPTKSGGYNCYLDGTPLTGSWYHGCSVCIHRNGSSEFKSVNSVELGDSEFEQKLDKAVAKAERVADAMNRAQGRLSA